MGSSRISAIVRSIIRSVDEGIAEPVRVGGATGAAQALLIAEYAQAIAGPLVVLCPDDDSAAEIAADVETLAATITRTGEGAFLPQVFHIPTWERSPYSPIAPSIRTRLARIAALSSMYEERSDRSQIIITTLAAACQATAPPSIFRESSILLREGESVESREALATRLVETGYMRVDPVEDPGSFAVRGDIVDVFPPNLDRPIRVELFGDVIEKMRTFDPASQRALGERVKPLKTVRIPPAREVLINRETASRARERIKAHADDLGIPRAVRDPILASVRDGIYPDHSDAWAPFAYDNPATLWDHLPPSAAVTWCDETSCLQRWNAFAEEQRALAADAIRTEIIAPPVESLFAWTKHTADSVQKRTRLFLDWLDVPEVSSSSNAPLISKHTLQITSNRDLLSSSRHSFQELDAQLRLWIKQGFRILALASTQSSLERIRYLLEERGIACRLGGNLSPSVVCLKQGSASAGFCWPTEGLVVLAEGEVLGANHTRKQRRATSAESGSAAKSWAGLQALSDLSVGDGVVHVDHGIGRYRGLVRLDLSGAPSDFLMVEYANKDRLYLPVYRLNVIQKYVGAGAEFALDRLGSQQFAKTKEKVRDAVKKLAIDLIQLYAQRKLRPGIRFSQRDSVFTEFEGKFPFDETPDQIKAINDVLSDLESGKAMDRLVCGDVGFGKTEVAIRAAFRAVTDGKQVAVLVPTTALAFQHEQSFTARLKDYPINVESISRFKSTKQQKEILARLAAGKVDIVLGTHRLLSRDVKFKDLGLLVVDEEQRFGVEHKERLKTIRVNAHVLTLTATPIPRTLHMALSGLRDISLMNTPPIDRLPIRTFVSRHEDSVIEQAIQVELARGGQVFYLHNRVQTIEEAAKHVRELVPSARVAVAHGQMTERQLEETMVSFYHHRIDVLVCTTIIESGLDVPSANTIIIDRADALGLAQLYQIRGRVGRSQHRAYAYLMIPAEGAITGEAKQRLEVIQRFVELGSGFGIASHDLEIRGGGDLLGANQSGHIALVGFDLYTELLEEAIRELEGKPIDPDRNSREPEIKSPFPAFLGDDYVPDVHQRLSLYRRFSAAAGEPDVNALEEELRDRFGPLPEEAQNLLWVIRIKILLKHAGIDAITVGTEKLSITPGPQSCLDPAKAISLVAGHPGRYQLTPDSRFIAKAPSSSLRDLFFELERLLDALSANKRPSMT